MEALGFIKTDVQLLKSRVDAINEKLIPHNIEIDKQIKETWASLTDKYNKSKRFWFFKRKQLTVEEYVKNDVTHFGGFFVMPNWYREFSYKKYNISLDIMALVNYGESEIYLSNKLAQELIGLETFFKVNKKMELLNG